MPIMKNNPNYGPPYKIHSHSPFDFEWNGVKAHCDKNGSITISQDHDDESFDEIKTSAAFVFRLANMLTATRRTKYSDTPYSPPTSSNEKEGSGEGG